MFVIFDKKTGYIRVTCTENPLGVVNLISNWYENYDIAHFPYVNFVKAGETLMKVEHNKLKIIGNKNELKLKGLTYEYNNYSALFEGE